MELLNSACGVGIEREKDADDADEFASENVGESGDPLTPVVASAQVSGLLDPSTALLSSSESLLLERSTALLCNGPAVGKVLDRDDLGLHMPHPHFVLLLHDVVGTIR